MASLTQMNKVHELRCNGWQPVERKSSEIRLGGPVLLVKNTPSHILVFASGDTRVATPSEIETW